MGLFSQTNIAINHIVNETEAVYHEAATKFGISDSVFLILYAICTVGDSCLLSDIVKLSSASKQTINSALRKMERENWIYLEQHDGRKKRLHLTENGKELAERTVKRQIQMENEIFEKWTKEEQELYIMLGQRYLNALKKKVAEL